MARYRKKPIVIEAMQLTKAGFETMPEWLMEGFRRGQLKLTPDGSPGLIIATLEGDMRASEDDWLIQGVKGELYPCRPDIFEATYEPVEFRHYPRR